MKTAQGFHQELFVLGCHREFHSRGLSTFSLKLVFVLMLALIVSLSFAAAAPTTFQTPTVCCEKTTSGLYCQDVPSAECAADATQVPTSCKATTYCKPGTCFDSNEGTCLDNTPQNVCNQNNGIWSEKPAPQCQLGCCVLGDQAAFVTLTRCKKLSSFLGLESNFKKDIKTEVSCISSVLGQEKGACVFESEFQKTCRVTTRADCNGGVSGNKTKGDFYRGKLCSAEELATNCGPTTKTACLPGKEEVYFVDSCGNTANIYDAGKLNDKEYWANIKDKTESCNPNPNAGNADNEGCGNCDYLQGTFCRADPRGGPTPTYGSNICADLNCKDTSNGNNYKHGESWCVNEEVGKFGGGNDPVGSRFYKHICINGEEVLEACADFRQHICIEGTIDYPEGTFSQAACRVNRWQDCAMQTLQVDCENDDRRDCIWLGGWGVQCVPKDSPGLKFWEGEEAEQICAVASTTCRVRTEEGISGIKDLRIDRGDECAEISGGEARIKQSWKNEMEQKCASLGDCGNKINWVGASGTDFDGFSINSVRS